MDGITLNDLAHQTDATLHGDGSVVITGVGSLTGAGEGEISFLISKKHRNELAETAASAVIISADDLEICPTNALVSDNPHLTYAKIANLLFPFPAYQGGVHSTAIVDESADIDPSAWIGPGAIIGRAVKIGVDCYIGPGCVIEPGCIMGDGCRLVARVTLCRGTRLGQRVQIHPGAVLGSDGFGYAKDNTQWVKVPQLGIVEVGDDVEIGANVAIDRGALGNTIIGDRVKLDNLIHMAHNVEIGDDTAIAGCVGFAGSTKVGKQCTMGGMCSISGHLEIGDNVHFTGRSMVTRSHKKPGVYSGGLPTMPNRDWLRAIAHLKRFDTLVRRVDELETRLKDNSEQK
ncbi:MAG: UDP-3-O-(3-hydroxymyristoyl)glucosamine N-acyltransferase [Candidatus Polarisedimenticolaceae bacterium]|nr:UDP-3-O-(3-hydroxymyristoyl)glucosamine N-acyltransferase [Candidatus Polarisedimenticolaceae bacterium]